MNRNIKIINWAVWAVLLLAAWEVSTRVGLVNRFILPPFSDVLKVGFEELRDGTIIVQLMNSMKIIIIGFLTSTLAAFLLAVVCNLCSVFEGFISFICTIMNPLPGVALIPMFMMWFGIGNGVLIALIVHAMIWPMITNLLAGFHSVPRIYEEWAANIECSFCDKVINVYLYSVMPYFISGLRIGWGRAWRALIAGEMVFGMIGSLGGLGYYIYKARSFGDMNKVLAGLIMIVFIGIVVENVMFKSISRHTVDKWGMK